MNLIVFSIFICAGLLEGRTTTTTTASPLDCYTQPPGRDKDNRVMTCLDKYAIIPDNLFCQKNVKRHRLSLTVKCARNSDDPKCGTTYNQTACSSSFETLLHCPWLCNVCPYAGYNYSERSAPLPWERNRTECPSQTTSHTFSTSTQTTVTVHKGGNGSPCASCNQWIIMLMVFIFIN